MHEFLLNVNHWHFIPFNAQKYEWQNFDIIFVIFSELLDSRQAWKYFSNFSYFSSFLLSELNNSFVIMTFLTLLIYFFLFPFKKILLWDLGSSNTRQFFVLLFSAVDLWLTLSMIFHVTALYWSQEIAFAP